MNWIRIVLKDSLELRDVERLAAYNTSWSQYAFTPYSENEMYRVAWETDGDATTIQYIQDPRMGVRYFLLSGVGIDTAAAFIRKRLATYSDSDIADLLQTAQTTEDRELAVLHAGVAAPAEYDATYAGYLQQALSDAEPLVRQAAVEAAVAMGWPQLRPPLEQLAQGDPVATVRQYADQALVSLRKHSWAAAPPA
ncbi:MAG: HEAT repeat domain-containing protein [Chloroflexota bacterium]|nr:HEAT repeat domain-containing protein [Chloroflexota bacterium]